MGACVEKYYTYVNLKIQVSEDSNSCSGEPDDILVELIKETLESTDRYDSVDVELVDCSIEEW